MTFSIQCLQCLQGSLNSPVWNSCTEWVRQMNFIHCLAFLSWTQSPCYPVLSLQSVCLKSMPDPSKVITCREDKALLLFSILPFYFKRIGNAADSCSRFHSREQKNKSAIPRRSVAELQANFMVMSKPTALVCCGEYLPSVSQSSANNLHH